MDETICSCLRCGHRWITALGHRPATCAKCKSRQWDSPRPQRQQGRTSTMDLLGQRLDAIESRLTALEAHPVAPPPAAAQPQPSRRQPVDRDGHQLDYDAF